MTPAARLETASLAVAIGGKRVCDALTITVQPRECWAILGSNGSGKTTLLHTLAGLRPAAGGLVRVNGVAIGDLPGRARARQIGVLLQDYDDVYSTTVLDTALMGRHPYLRPWEFETPMDMQVAHDALRELGLAGMEDRPLNTLSGGERRRARIATVVVQNPNVYLLDEPSNHLDVHHQIHVLELLRATLARHGASVLMAIHDVNLAARISTHAILLLGAGRVAAGRFDEVVSPENLSEMYAHDIQRIRTGSRNLYYPA
jgi:iron complex transport system ATP-binding protein